MQWKDTFHSVAKGDLANGEGGVARTTPQSNGRSLEDLYAFLVALLDLNVDADCVPSAELGNVCFQLRLFEFFQGCGHDLDSKRLECDYLRTVSQVERCRSARI